MDMDEKNISAQEFEFKAEMKQLLHLIVHSLYTNPEIFIRELVSNSSDALNKLRFIRLTEKDILNPEAELNIKINLDKENNTFSITDTGIGMNREDLIAQLGTVASSGTLNFLKSMKEQNQSLDSNLIGQFGVGFYSVFMVTDEITVETKNALTGSKAYRWVSQGQDTYKIEEIEKEIRGTKISFKLKGEYKEYLEDYKVKSILKKYSNFVDFPVFVNEETVNTVSAIWQKKKDDVSDEELNEFYKFITNDHQESLGQLQISIEGNINFKALLFIPQTAPPALFKDINEKSLQLYSSRVFIQDDCKDLLPDYLKFVRGVVDTEDLPLNVSREVIQNSPITAKIKNVLTSKLLALLEEWSDKDKEKYNKFFTQFGSLFKTGVNSDYSNRDKIIELLRFDSSKAEKSEMTSFYGYVTRMKSDQTEIYYVLGEHRDLIEKNPNLEYFKKNDIEVIYLTDPVDYFTIPYITEFDKKPLKSIDKADIKNDTKNEDISEDFKKSVIDRFKAVLADRVEDVKESTRLVDSAVTLVTGNAGLDPQMERMMQMLDKNYTSAKRILEINLNHELIRNIEELNKFEINNKFVEQLINQLFEGALLIDGYLKNPADYVKRMTEIMTNATKK
jgi:molecular chaperone HtpG